MTPNRVTKLHVAGITLLAAWALDSFSKTWASARVEASFDGRGEVLPASWLVYTRNPGAVFGWMADWPDPLRNLVFAVVAGLTAWLVFSIYRGLAPGERLNAFALGLLVGGGVGNLMDRFRLGAAVDIFQVPDWPGYAGSGPTMNLADVLIVLGVAILLLELLVSEGVSRAAGAAGFSQERADSPKAEPGAPGAGVRAKKNTWPYAD